MESRCLWNLRPRQGGAPSIKDLWLRFREVNFYSALMTKGVVKETNADKTFTMI